MTLHPVIIEIVGGAQLSRSQRVPLQRRTAASALDESARLAGLPAGAWRQDAEGVPVCEDGVCWSIGHKAGWAAGVVSGEPIGIDIEHVVPRRAEMFDEVASAAEWALVRTGLGAPLPLDAWTARTASQSAPGRLDWRTFFHVWTAKEATLKANRVGIGHMDRCRVVAMPAADQATVTLDGMEWCVRFLGHADHLAAVAFRGPHVATWRILPGVEDSPAPG